MSDDLFTPTIKAPAPTATPPWRPDSIVYPAFFGGVLTATVLGLINWRRLDLGRNALLLIAGAGLACLIGRIVVVAAVGGTTVGRISGSIAGLLTWLVINHLQRRPFRAALNRGVEPSSLIWPGIGATLGLGLVEGILIFGVVA